jgi:tricarballylate dehydrogenase
MTKSDQPDVIVVGSGNAAFCAALTAREHGASVLMLEKGSSDWIGGNTWFTAGAYRMAHEGLDDLLGLIDAPNGRVDLPPYPPSSYEADMRRTTEGRCDPDLTGILVREAREAAVWMHRQGVGWRLMPERQAHESGGQLRFWGGLSLGTAGGGAGLIEAYLRASRDAGIDLRTSSAVESLITVGGDVIGVRVRTAEGLTDVHAGAVVLASGGFEADADLRARHLGEPWRAALVRGTPHNTGEAMLAAIAIGAQADGDWQSCHAIAWDADAPAFGDRAVSNRYSRQGYPYGLVVNVNGERFIDEGADFRNYTYAKYGAEILRQPSGIAFQLFDAKTLPLISPIDYATAETSRFDAESIEELAVRAGIDAAALRETIATFNASVGAGPIDPARLDGVGTTGVAPPKSNWAQALDTPPFAAFAVRCGVTFTFGGLRIGPDGAALREDGAPIPGLFAAGETVGGLFYHNYPGGTGLASGAVFGRRAGRAAAVRARLTAAASPAATGDATPLGPTS